MFVLTQPIQLPDYLLANLRALDLGKKEGMKEVSKKRWIEYRINIRKRIDKDPS